MQGMLSPIFPLPSHHVGSPPWTDYNSRVSHLVAKKKKMGQMDAEVYPPGQNPSYYNPWVTMPHPTIPAPNTGQYGGPWPFAVLRPEAPKHNHSGWVQVQLANRVDLENSTVAEKLQYDAFKWYCAQIDGWFLSFYEIAPDSVPKRASGINLRSVRRVQTVSQLSSSLVILILETGSFEFSVRPEEAEAWCAAITETILAASKLRAEASETNMSNVRRSLQQNLQTSKSFSPRGLGPLQTQMRHSWAACVKAVSQGQSAPLEAFEDMFGLYDADGNETLSLQEIGTMLMDLLGIRKAEVEHALERQFQECRNAETLDFKTQSRLRDAARTGTSLGKDLLSDYASRLSGQGFETRCILLQSQLDLSADQRVALPEFLSAAPRVLLPESELKQEANFYKSVSMVLKIAQKAQFFSAQGDADCDNSGICIHQ